MWWNRLICLKILLHHFTLSQPITDGSGIEKLTNFGECCPCTTSKFDNNIGSGTGGVDDCPCRSRDADAVGSPSILFPNAVRSLWPSVRQGGPKEDPKPLLHPEVGFASSVLETLREVTDEEYHEALARDAARNAAKSMEPRGSSFNDAMPEESRNSVTIVVNPKKSAESEEHVLSEASHVQESRCIHSPLGSARSNKLEYLTLPSAKPPSLLKEIFSLHKQPKRLSIKPKNMFDMNIGASNVQERLVDGATEGLEGLKLKSNPSLLTLFPENTFQAKKRKSDSLMKKNLLGKNSIKNSAGNVDSLMSLKKKAGDGLFDSFSVPKLRLDNPFQKSLDDESDDNSASFKKPPFLEDLFKMRDAEIIPLKKVSDFVKNREIFNIPNLKNKPILFENERADKNIFSKIKPIKIGDLFRNPLKLEPIKKEFNRDIDCESDVRKKHPNPNLQKKSKDKFIKTKILDTLPKISENRAVKTEILDTLPNPSESRPVTVKCDRNITGKTPVTTSSKESLDYFENLEDSNETSENDMKIVLHDETLNIDNDNISTTENVKSANINVDKDQLGQSDHFIKKQNNDNEEDKEEFCLVNRDIIEDSVSDTSNHILHTIPREKNYDNINTSAEDIDTKENISKEDKEFKENISTENKQFEENESDFQEDEELDVKPLSKENVEDSSSLKQLNKTSTIIKEQDTEENDSIVKNVKDINCSNFKEITSLPDPSNENTDEETQIITTSNLSVESIELTTLFTSILNDDDSEVTTESTNEISYEDLQEMSNSLLQLNDIKERMRNISDSKCKQDFEDNFKSSDLTELTTKSVVIEEVSDDQIDNSDVQSRTSEIANNPLSDSTTTSQDLISTETGAENAEECISVEDRSVEDISLEDINSTSVVNNSNEKNLCKSDIEFPKRSSSETKTAKNNDAEINEMFVSASDPVAKVVRRPISTSARNSILGPPLRQNIIVQPSSLISGSDLFNRPVPDITDVLNLNTQLPSLNDITSRISNSALLPNLNDALGSSPQLPTFNDIKSKISSLFRVSESAESASIENQRPVLMPIMTTDGSSTSFKTLWPHNKKSDALSSLLNRKETVTENNPFRSTADFRDAMRSPRPHLLGDTIDTPISVLSDNFRSFTENSLRNIQQTLKSTLKPGSSEFNLNDSFKNTENIFDAISKTHSDVNDKLQSFHSNLNDRLSSIHESVFDQNNSPLFTIPLNGGSKSRLIGTPQSNIQRIKKPTLANRSVQRNFLGKPSDIHVTLPKNLGQSSLQSFKQPVLFKSTSDLKPITITRFKATTTKPFSLRPLNRPAISRQYGDGIVNLKPQRLIKGKPISTFGKEPITIPPVISKSVLRKPLTKVKVSFSTTVRPTTTLMPKLKSSLPRTNIPSRNFKNIKRKLNSAYDSTGSPSELDLSRVLAADLSRNLKFAENAEDGSYNTTGKKTEPSLLNKGVSKEPPSGLSLSRIPTAYLSRKLKSTENENDYINTTGTKPKPSLLNKGVFKSNEPSSRKSLLPQTVAWPRSTENSFLSKVREAMKVRLSNLGQNANGSTNKIKTGVAPVTSTVKYIVDSDEEEDIDSTDVLSLSTHSPIKLSNTKSTAWSTIRPKSGPATSAPEVSDDVLASIENKQNSRETITPETEIWPKFTGARFRSASKLSQPEVERVISTSDQETQSASVKSVRTEDQPLKENVSYRCRMVCTKE